MALSKKKAIHILSVTEDKIVPLKEIPLPEPPLYMVSGHGGLEVTRINPVSNYGLSFVVIIHFLQK